jgi:hypothetical protein
MMRIEARVGDLVRRIWDDQAHVGYSVPRRSGGRVTSCAIRSVHMEEMRSTSFWFSLKTGGNSLSVVQPQNHYDGFIVWTSKPRSMVL